MAKRKDIEITGSETAANPENAAAPVKSELPTVESPSISPAVETSARAGRRVEVPAIEPKIESKAETPAIEPVTATQRLRPPQLFVLRPRHKRYALLAASVTFAAALGAIVGALASGGFSAPTPAKPDVAAIEENKAMQQSIARLGKEVTTLKANLDAANKSAHTQIAKITDRLEQRSADITGSISAPQTTAAAAPALVPAPLPSPRPRRASEIQPPARAAVVPGWTIRDTRGGYVYVENHGEIYQVAARRAAARPRPGANRSSGRTAAGW